MNEAKWVNSERKNALKSDKGKQQREKTAKANKSKNEDLHLILFSRSLSGVICWPKWAGSKRLETNDFGLLHLDIPTAFISNGICKGSASADHMRGLNTRRESNGMEQTGQLSSGKLGFTSADVRASSDLQGITRAFTVERVSLSSPHRQRGIPRPDKLISRSR